MEKETTLRVWKVLDSSTKEIRFIEITFSTTQFRMTHNILTGVEQCLLWGMQHSNHGYL